MRKRWPRSLFAQNLVLILGLCAVAQISTLAVYVLQQRPRVVELGKLAALQLNTLNNILTTLPPGQREALIQRLNQGGNLHVLRSGETPAGTSATPGPLADWFVHAVQDNADPDIDVRWIGRPSPQVVAHVNIGGQRYWVSQPIHLDLHYQWVTWLTGLSLGVALLSASVALLIQRRINRPLQAIARAAGKLAAGGKPERLPQYPVSELAVVAEQFNRMTDSLAELETTRAVMLAGISHDIRTPLTKLRLSLAIEAPAAEANLTRYIRQIDTIVGQFVDFARTDSDEPLAEGDLNTLVLQLAEEFAERGHRFEVSLGDLPHSVFRPVATQRMVRNLMENAVKYGVRDVALQTQVQPNPDGTPLLLINVLDRGPGLTPAEAERLIRPFMRADTGRSAVSGSGLGLAIVDRLARLHGGRLRLLMRDGGGLQASIALPPHPPAAPGSA